jgi:2-oxoglutarate dehydrogenase E2 component (dihydrolipoamide succinyltransferase)
MALDIVIPPLGESIREAVIARWLKRVGEHAAADEPVVQLETDKVTMDLPAPAAGVLSEQRFAEGATVKIGEVVGRIALGSSQAASAPAAAPSTKPPSQPPAMAKPPTATPAPVAAASRAVTSPPTVTSAPPAPRAAAPASDASMDGRPLPPSMRRALREHAADRNGHGAPDAAEPSAPPLRTMTAPPVIYMQNAGTPQKSAPAVAPAGAGSEEEVVPMSPLRKRIAERLVQAQHSSASLTTFNEIDMSHVLALREHYKDTFLKKYNVKLGLMSFFAKAAIASLMDYPGLNAEVREGAIVYKKHYHIGVAVGSGKGLVVPVIRHADRLTFAEIEQAIAAYAVKVKENKLTLEDLSGGTFTLTNGGVFGSMLSTPLLNYPQTGILGMHNIVRRPVVVGNAIEARPVMYVAVTYDHRVVDGREAVLFLVGIKERIENPERLMLSL